MRYLTACRVAANAMNTAYGPDEETYAPCATLSAIDKDLFCATVLPAPDIDVVPQPPG